MANDVYFVTAHTFGAKVGERIKSFVDEDDLYELPSNEWLVRFEGTAQELAEKAGIRGGNDRLGTGLVLPVTTYSGRASTELWDWLSAKGF